LLTEKSFWLRGVDLNHRPLGMSPLMAERTYKSRELQPRKHCI
jgi:hypothetical protein